MPRLNTRDRVSEFLWWMIMILGVLLTVVGWMRFLVA